MTHHISVSQSRLISSYNFFLQLESSPDGQLWYIYCWYLVTFVIGFIFTAFTKLLSSSSVAFLDWVQHHGQHPWSAPLPLGTTCSRYEKVPVLKSFWITSCMCFTLWNMPCCWPVALWSMMMDAQSSVYRQARCGSACVVIGGQKGRPGWA